MVTLQTFLQTTGNPRYIITRSTQTHSIIPYNKDNEQWMGHNWPKGRINFKPGGLVWGHMRSNELFWASVCLSPVLWKCFVDSPDWLGVIQGTQCMRVVPSKSCLCSALSHRHHIGSHHKLRRRVGQGLVPTLDTVTTWFLMSKASITSRDQGSQKYHPVAVGAVLASRMLLLELKVIGCFSNFLLDD